MNYKVLLMLILVAMLGACSTPRNVAYFQGIDELTAKQRELMTQTYNPKICADDLLTINVSSKDPSVAAPYNPPAYSYYMQGEQQVMLLPYKTYIPIWSIRRGISSFRSWGVSIWPV